MDNCKKVIKDIDAAIVASTQRVISTYYQPTDNAAKNRRKERD